MSCLFVMMRQEMIMTNRSPFYNGHLHIYKMIESKGMQYWQNVRDSNIVLDDAHMMESCRND